ncbi:Not3-domain-containing protein, partial [Cyberlindnera jadinii NRRL Y-1542]
MSQRKLQQEIDKVFKKVKEGLEIFDGYYDKLQTCENQSQKEKLESDLKREIKKLQKQRDQIKSWLSGNEVKDKKLLLENRKTIENAMERFKVVEKNMKTKAYSREGLNQDRNDPRQKEKEETSEFLQQMIEDLERQNEKHEATIDHLQNSGKKSKKLDGATKQEISDLQDKMDRNLWHLDKLEQVQRLIMNDMLDCEPVNDLQEDIKYYVEENEDPDFLEDDAIYDDLKLDEVEDSFGNVAELAPKEEEHESVLIDDTPKKPVVHQQTPPHSSGSATSTTTSTASIPPPAATATNIPPSSTLANASHSHSSGTVTQFTSNGTTTTLKPAILQKQELKYASVAANALNSGSQQQTTPSHASKVVPPPGLSNTPRIGTPLSSYVSLNHLEGAPADFNGASDASKTASVLESIKDLINKPAPLEDISKMLDISLLNCPDSLDADRARTYRPSNPHPTPSAYPQEPLPELTYSS